VQNILMLITSHQNWFGFSNWCALETITLLHTASLSDFELLVTVSTESEFYVLPVTLSYLSLTVYFVSYQLQTRWQH